MMMMMTKLPSLVCAEKQLENLFSLPHQTKS